MSVMEVEQFVAEHVVDGEPGLDALDEQLLDQVVGQARERGVKLAGEGGLLAALTKRLLESALEGEITDHLGYDRHDAAGGALADVEVRIGKFEVQVGRVEHVVRVGERGLVLIIVLRMRVGVTRV